MEHGPLSPNVIRQVNPRRWTPDHLGSEFSGIGPGSTEYLCTSMDVRSTEYGYRELIDAPAGLLLPRGWKGTTGDNGDMLSKVDHHRVGMAMDQSYKHSRSSAS